MNLRALARGRECQVRIPGICNRDPAATVPAHYRMAGLYGTGMKPPDEIAAWACFCCHQLVDGRSYSAEYTREQIRLAHAEGVLRTIAILLDEGVIG